MTQYFTDNWRNIQNFQARPDYILIASYPKTGHLNPPSQHPCRSSGPFARWLIPFLI
uniref:Uncharacterized protein n=1 Tax=Seriola lalandi dorsalis TaxID=1841481 RepID=A0A3B4WNV0_SERLL